MMGHMRHLFNALRRRHGEWTLFAVLRRPRKVSGRWNLVVAARWLIKSRLFDDMRLILDALHEVAAPEGMSEIGGVFIFSEPDQVADAADVLLNGRSIQRPVGLVRRKNFYFRDRSVSRGYIWAANLPTPASAAAAV